MDYIKNSDQNFESENDSRDRISSKSVTIPVIEEKVQVDKKVVETGKVRITKKVKEEEVTINTPLDHEVVEVERVAVNQIVDAPPGVKQEGDTLIIPVLKEIVVTKLMVVEEIRVTLKTVEVPSQLKTTLLKEEVNVERERKDLQPRKGEQKNKLKDE